MAEFVERRCEEMLPIFNQMERLTLFSNKEVKNIAKRMRELEYKIQRHTKTKEDYLTYIHYGMDLMKLVKQRREKYQIKDKRSDVDFSIANKINSLYNDAIFKFQDDIRFWIAYIKFCKQVKFSSSANTMIARMLQVHQDKPKCWHIAAQWQIKETKNIDTARQYLLRGLHFHPKSELLVLDMMKLELDEALKDPDEMKRVLVIYEQAFKNIKSIDFAIEILNTVTQYKNTEKMQSKIASDMVKEYSHEPDMWDTMARRELKGLVQPKFGDEQMEIKEPQVMSLRDRINNCYEVYQTAVKKVKNEKMWSLFIDCMLEINQEDETLPNFKRKFLKGALMQGHQAKKLKEKYYLYWIDMLNTDEIDLDEKAKNRLHEILCWANETLPKSESLWKAKIDFLYGTDQEELAVAAFSEAVTNVGNNCLSIWKSKLLYTQAKYPHKIEQFFQDALKSNPEVVNFFKPYYVEWLVLSKDISKARQKYDELCLLSPVSLELHKKMASLELMQPEISLRYTRKTHEMATLQFGKESTDVWMEYINFESKHGEPTKVSVIYDRAINTLKKDVVDNFITEFSLIRAGDSM